MKHEWESSFKEGLALRDRPYYEIFGFEADPLSLEPIQEESELVNFERDVNDILRLIAMARSGKVQIIPIIGLPGGGRTSIINIVTKIIDSFESSHKKEVSSFAKKINIKIIGANAFQYSLDEVEDENHNKKDYFTVLMEEIHNEKVTHLFVDNCNILRRQSVFPYIEAIIERLNQPFVFILMFSPSSYNRFLSEFVFSEFDESTIIGECTIRPMSDENLKTILQKRITNIYDFIEKGAVEKIFTYAYGTPKTTLEIFKRCMEELAIIQSGKIDDNLVKKICQRKNLISKEELEHNLTETQQEFLKRIIELGDYLIADEMAQEMGLNRSSVVRMYLRLQDMGYINKYKSGNRKIYYIRNSVKRYVEYKILREYYMDNQDERGEWL